MLKKVKKYSIFALSLLLVLSNFSFATQQMLCLMNDVDITCSCPMNEGSDSPGGLSIAAKDSPCCSNNTIELTNRNNLQIAGNELPKDITSFSAAFINLDLEFDCNSHFENSFTALKEHIPKAEIPILNSSLLI